MNAANLAAIANAIGAIADQPEDYRHGLAKLIRESQKPIDQYTIKELLNIHIAYTAYYRRVLGHANTIDRAPTAH